MLALCAQLLIACSSKPVYNKDSFATDSPFKLKVAGQVMTACESARRALLGQGYLIDSASSDKVKGRKSYKSEDNRSTYIEMNVVCLSDNTGSTLYANGVLSTYDLKRSGTSASVGVKAVGSISLPFGQSADSMVKVAEETIDDKDFYSRFFAAVNNNLSEAQPSSVPTVAETFPAQAVPALEPAPKPVTTSAPVIPSEPAPAPAPAATSATASKPAPDPASTPASAPAPVPTLTPASAAAPESTSAPAPAATPVSTPTSATTSTPTTETPH